MRVVLRLVARPLKAPRPDSQRAWLAAAAAFFAGFVVFGIMYSFGVFVEPMAAAFHVSRAATSAFFSITGLVFYVIGSLTGYLSDRYGPRLVVGTGAIVMGGGLILTAFIGQMWVGYFCYGVGAGVGAACAYVPTLASVGGWFVKRRNTALGIAAAGTGSGMLVVPPLAAALIESFGWRATYVIFGIGSALLLMLCAAAVGPPPITHARVSRPLGRVVRSSEFILLYVSWVLATTALFVPFVFLPAFAHSHGAGKVAASALLSVLGGTSIMGRLGIGVLGDWIGTRRLFKVAVFVMGASYLLWLSFPSYGS
ncbi:MAG: MFS transporter, partial [Stellaceae bacterium]